MKIPRKKITAHEFYITNLTLTELCPGCKSEPKPTNGLRYGPNCQRKIASGAKATKARAFICIPNGTPSGKKTEGKKNDSAKAS